MGRQTDGNRKAEAEKVCEHVKSRHSACTWGGRQTETERQRPRKCVSMSSHVIQRVHGEADRRKQKGRGRERKKQSRTGETHSEPVTKNSGSQLSL